MITLNGNIMCAIDVETTGTQAGFHEITQVCFLPLDDNLEPRKDVAPFDLLLKIEREERIDWNALKVSKINFMKHQQVAMDKFSAADLFDDWIVKLNIPPNKRISPLAHNWPFDREFIKEWLQPSAYNIYIDGRFRDTMASANYINDVYDFLNESMPFAKINLGYIASLLKIEHANSHSALGDCVVTAKVYKSLLNRGYLTGAQ